MQPLPDSLNLRVMFLVAMLGAFLAFIGWCRAIPILLAHCPGGSG